MAKWFFLGILLLAITVSFFVPAQAQNAANVCLNSTYGSKIDAILGRVTAMTQAEKESDFMKKDIRQILGHLENLAGLSHYLCEGSNFRNDPRVQNRCRPSYSTAKTRANDFYEKYTKFLCVNRPLCSSSSFNFSSTP